MTFVAYGFCVDGSIVFVPTDRSVNGRRCRGAVRQQATNCNETEEVPDHAEPLCGKQHEVRRRRLRSIG